MSRGQDAINFGWCAIDCKFAEMSSRNCELSIVKRELGTVNCCFALKLAIFTITGGLRGNCALFGCLLTSLGSQLEASWIRLRDSRATLGVFLDRVTEAPGRQYDFGYQNPSCRRSFRTAK